MPLPQVIVTSGEYAPNLHNGGGTEVVNGGALRYEYLHEARRATTRPEKESKVVLVALPYSVSLGEEMLLAVFDAFKDLTGAKIRFIIKFHPVIPPELLTVWLAPWPAHFQKTDKSISEILEEVDLVIYSSSTVGLEALARGARVVRYCSEHTLELDPADNLGETTVRSCSESDIRELVFSALRDSSASSLDAGKLNKLFSPVNDGVWRRVIKGLKGDGDAA